MLGGGEIKGEQTMAHHGRNEDTYLNKGGVNEVTAANAKDSVDKKHQQNSDTKLNSGGIYQVSAREMVKAIYNLAVQTFYLAIETGRNFFNLIDGIVDDYGDETGIDVINSVNQTYIPSLKCYSTEETIDVETKLLCHFIGDDEDTDTIDESSSEHTFTFYNQAQIDTDQYKFGDSSLKLGNSNYVDILGNTSDWQFGTDNFTVEFWTYVTQNFGIGSSKFIECGAVWGLQWISAGLMFWTADANAIAPNDCISLNAWHHIAVCNVSGTVSIYVDGTDVTSSRAGTINISSTSTIRLGGTDPNYGSVYGWMDELRISKGVARYTTTFTPQTEEFRGEIKNIILISNAFDSDLEPEYARITVLEEDIDEVTLNTDLLAYISRDDGTTWTQATLSQENILEQTKQSLIASADISGQPSGTKMRYKYVTDNTKNLKIHSTALLWD